MEKLRIVFMGTPDFAVGILDAIYQNNYEIVGVVTAVDKPAGRGQKINESAVKKYAIEKNLKVLQPTNLKSEEFLEELRLLNANLQVVVAFRMLPEVVWKMPKLGTFNLHASLLPEYRGAAPINWAIINGETETGVTTFFIDDKIDTGAMILNKKVEIAPEESAGELHDKLMHLGKEAVLETLQQIEQGSVQTTIQPNYETKTAYKLNKENTKINWSLPGQQIVNLIRGLHPHPSAWSNFIHQNQILQVKIHKAEFEKIKPTHQPLEVIIEKKNLKICVSDGYIHIKELQMPGKKSTDIVSFLNGFHFSIDTKFY